MSAHEASAELGQVISHNALRRLAGTRTYERGREYFESGCVGPLSRANGSVAAEVTGSLVYQARLWLNGSGLDYSCTCPVGDDGECCKHVVALGLAHLAPDHPASRKQAPRRRRPISTGALRADLANRGKDELVALLMEQAEFNEPLRQSLVTDAAGRRGRKVNLATFRKAIDEASDPHGFVSWRDAHGFTTDIDRVVDSLERLLAAGHAAETVGLAEYALTAIERAMNSVDDSDGDMGALLERVQSIHHSACVAAKPDPSVLARRLFDWEMRTDWDTFYHAAQTYADVLGDQGLRVYRKAAEAVWSRVRALRPGDDRKGDSFARRFRITSIMEALAVQAGDTEALVAVKQRDLSMPYAFLQIAEIYRAGRKPDQALEWAERGVQEFKDERPDDRLMEFLADEYHRRKRHDDATTLIWTVFVASPDLDGYKNLKTHADRNGRWAEWREKALARLRTAEKPATPSNAGRFAFTRRADRSALVRIFLWEKNPDAAWAEGRAGGCSDGLWLDLAAARERDHPGDALPIYQRQVESSLSRKNYEGYREAVRFLRKVRGVMSAIGPDEAFVRYLASIRATHKAKRNFIKLLDHARWS